MREQEKASHDRTNQQRLFFLACDFSPLYPDSGVLWCLPAHYTCTQSWSRLATPGAFFGAVVLAFFLLSRSVR